MNRRTPASRPKRQGAPRLAGELPRSAGPPKVALLIETSTEYGRGLLRGIVRYARLHGPWSFTLAPGHLDQVHPAADSWKGDGIIARIRSPEMEDVIRSTGVPYVASTLSEPTDRALKRQAGEIRTNPVAIAKMGATHLLDLGLRNFAYCGLADLQWSSAREQAFSRYLGELGFECRTKQVTSANWMQQPRWMKTWKDEQPILAKWLWSLPKPTGLMACNDACGRGVLEVCTTARIHVPDEIAVIGVDNDELLCELSDPPLSSVALDVESAGYEAARMLDALMTGRSVLASVVWVQSTHIVHRRSSDVIAREDPLVARALRFIRDNSRTALSVDDVASALGVCRRTLERRMSGAVGRTILDEIMRCHLVRAKQLLVETGLSCGQIAREAGFGSLKTFNRTFRLKEKMTPNSFRVRATLAQRN
jgi:LacI family transcriptional regulator, galactose operon repressor